MILGSFTIGFRVSSDYTGNSCTNDCAQKFFWRPVFLELQMSMENPSRPALLRRIRVWLVLFIAGLVLSGLTAFPLERELVLLNHMLGVALIAPSGGEPALHTWLRKVLEALTAT